MVPSQRGVLWGVFALFQTCTGLLARSISELTGSSLWQRRSFSRPSFPSDVISHALNAGTRCNRYIGCRCKDFPRGMVLRHPVVSLHRPKQQRYIGWGGTSSTPVRESSDYFPICRLPVRANAPTPRVGFKPTSADRQSTMIGQTTLSGHS